MIHYICRNGQQDTVVPFLCAAGGALRNTLRITPYEDIFSRGSLAAGHLIFTDMDRLSGHELEAAHMIARSMRDAVPGIRVLNEPARSRQRYSLLTTLWKEGVNPFRAARLDDTIPALRYPVFIRREDGAFGPETDLLYSEEELQDAIANLPARGLPLRGRIAVEYCAEKNADGYYRKYGAFRVADRILPQHIQFSRHWMVKQDTNVITPAFVAEEEQYIRQNPHEAELRTIFDRAHVEFGRIDYAFAGGRLIVYEINSNPAFPHGNHRNGREHLRQEAGRRLVEALQEADAPLTTTGTVRCFPRGGGVQTSPARANAPQRIFQMVGKSALLDRAIALYWKAVPESLRRMIPAELKKSTMYMLSWLFMREPG
jgi:hypothetical protein